MILVEAVYNLTDNLPKSEIYGLSSQMRRSAVSIPSNIAEGHKRGTRKDYRQFLLIALGSSAELETQLILCSRIYKDLEFKEINDLILEIQKILSVIIKKLNS